MGRWTRMVELMARRGRRKKKEPEADERPTPPLAVQTVRRDRVTCPHCHTANVRSDGRHRGTGYYICMVCAEPDSCSRRRFQVRIDRRLSSLMPEGSWSGLRCWIFGGGSSGHRFRWDAIKARDRTIAINDAWMLFREQGRAPTLAFSGDQMFWKTRGGDVEYKAATGHRVALAHGKIPDDVLTVPTRDDAGHWAEEFDAGIRWGKNSGVAALNLADVLGADEVYLVGFDLDGRNRDGVALEGLDEMHEGFRQTFEAIAGDVRADVFNCNPRSALECFEKTSEFCS